MPLNFSTSFVFYTVTTPLKDTNLWRGFCCNHTQAWIYLFVAVRNYYCTVPMGLPVFQLFCLQPTVYFVARNQKSGAEHNILFVVFYWPFIAEDPESLGGYQGPIQTGLGLPIKLVPSTRISIQCATRIGPNVYSLCSVLLGVSAILPSLHTSAFSSCKTYQSF